MSPQSTELLVGAVVALLTAIAGYIARPRVERMRERRRVRKEVEAQTAAPLTPPEVK